MNFARSDLLSLPSSRQFQHWQLNLAPPIEVMLGSDEKVPARPENQLQDPEGFSLWQDFLIFMDDIRDMDEPHLLCSDPIYVKWVLNFGKVENIPVEHLEYLRRKYREDYLKWRELVDRPSRKRKRPSPKRNPKRECVIDLTCDEELN